MGRCVQAASGEPALAATLRVAPAVAILARPYTLLRGMLTYSRPDGTEIVFTYYMLLVYFTPLSRYTIRTDFMLLR